MKFGTSGLRGLVVDLDGRASALYTEAFARHLLATGAAKYGNAVIVGRDLQASSPSIAATCIGALERAGMKPVDCDAIPTPALALYGMALKAACLMVTGSHIPADRNGIKFYRPDGEIDKNDERITLIAAELAKGKIDFAPGAGEDGSPHAEALFIARNSALLPAGALSRLRIGVYQHSTVARELFLSILQAYGADVVVLGRSPPFSPVDTEAVSSETIALLKGWTKEHGLDAIVSTDGDGDRPLISDETGEPLRGDLLGLITAQFLGADAVVTPVTSHSGIEEAGAFKTIRTRVGSPFVIAGMQDALSAGYSGVVGFEADGGTLTGSGFLIGDSTLNPLPTRDSFLPILATLALRAAGDRPLSHIASDISLRFAAADRLEDFPTETSAALMAHLGASDDNLGTFLSPLGTVASKSEIDGLRVTFSDGRIVDPRPSGNAPKMRCYVGATSETEAKTLLAQGLSLLRSWYQVRSAD